jgi:hypothetical protein
MDIETLVLKALPLLLLYPSSLFLLVSASHKFLELVRLVNNMPVNRRAKRQLWNVENMLQEKHNKRREL